VIMPLLSMRLLLTMSQPGHILVNSVVVYLDYVITTKYNFRLLFAFYPRLL